MGSNLDRHELNLNWFR